LVLKDFLQLDYRKLAAVLADCSDLRAALGLEVVPHFTTFQKAARRLLTASAVSSLLDETLAVAKVQGLLGSRSKLAALDGTGWEAHHVSHYYVRRRANNGKTRHETTYRRFPKAGVLCDCKSHLILAIVPGRGPGPDAWHFRTALDQALRRKPIDALAADAGYDGEHNHVYAREECGVNTFIPPKIGRPTKQLPSGFWRRWMARYLKRTRYTQRWQSETVNSMVKRLLGSALRARSYFPMPRTLAPSDHLEYHDPQTIAGFLQSSIEAIASPAISRTSLRLVRRSEGLRSADRRC